MSPPKLIDGARKPIAALLVGVALTQGVAAAASAEAVRVAIDGGTEDIIGPACVIAILALAAGLAVLGERYVGEKLAQSFVFDARKQLFEAVVAHGTSGREARWLTPMVGDLSALRNWAARGPVRLATASLAGGAASAWFVFAWPGQSVALAPFAIGLLIMGFCMRRLSCVISEQRIVRGSLTRFLLRRIRAEVSGNVSPRGHGRKTLSERSASLGREAERRAFMVGSMEAIAVASGALSALCLIVVTFQTSEIDKGAMFAGLGLIAFIATRLSEISRALHAHAGGMIAIKRIDCLLNGSVEEQKE